MSYWNYRIIRNTTNDAVTYEIHEVYYNDRNEIVSWTEDPMCPLGESAGELRNDIFYFMSAFKFPVLNIVREGEKERLREDEDAHGVIPGHYFEVMDRASVVMAHFDEFVVSHPAVRMNDRLKEAAQKTVDALYGFYSEAAEVCFEVEGEDGSHKAES